MARKVRIGFIGAGFMGQLAHIRSYALLRDECELVELAAGAGCVHMLGYQRRCDPATREAKRVVDGWKENGAMGALRYLRVCYSDGDWIANAQRALIDAGEEPPPFPAEEPPPEFADDDDACWALAQGVDQLVHPLNLLRHFVGERYRVVFVHP